MTLSGGNPQSWIKPIQSDGNIAKGFYGSHRGRAAIWNIPNPTPGWVYYWPRSDMEYHFKVDGWVVVKTTDPEFKSPLTGDNFGQQLDSLLRLSNHICMKIPEREYALLRERKAEAARGAEVAATEAYLDSEEARAEQERFGPNTSGPIRFKRPGHGTRRVLATET